MTKRSAFMFNNKEYILEVFKEKSFSRAAKNLYVSQPSLSATVKRIEEKLSAPIFDRSTAPVTPTEIGMQYINTALEIKKCEEDFSNYLNDNFNLLKSEIKLGGTHLFSSYVIPSMISGFNKANPHTEFKIAEHHSKTLIALLLDGELDLIIDNSEISNENIISFPYSSEMILLAVPENLPINESLEKYRLSFEDIKKNKHKTDSCPRVSLELFKNEPFIFLKSENNTGKKAHLLCRKHNFTPNIVFELDQQVTSYNITSSGMGISFVSDTLIKNLNASKNIVYYKLTDEEINRDIYFFAKKNKYLTKACKKFIEENISQE